MDAQRESVAAELRQIEQVLTEIIGWPSRWSGRVELTGDPAVWGAKPYGCDIVINKSLLGHEERWRTLIHEMLHSYSVGYNRRDYDEACGWEEGVVEQLQRLLRPEIFPRLSVQVGEDAFRKTEEAHKYNAYVAALETLRAEVGQDERAFYLRLLATPIAARSGLLVQMGRRMRGSEFGDYVRIFAASNATLKTKR